MNSATRMLDPLRRLIPNLGTVSHGERVRASVGAMLGLLITGFVSRLALGSSSDLPLLIAPMGASAVLLFAVPASPLAQPWSILGGNTAAALIGITCGRFIADPTAAAAVACACAIGAMLLLRCLHPPSGAVALTAVLGGPAIHAAGYTFAIWPVGLNSLLLLGAALLFNNATGRRYPHLAPPKAQEGAGPAVTGQDVDAALRRHDELIDIDREDLLDIVHEAEDEARSRRLAHATCADVMSSVDTTLSPQTSIEVALARLGEEGRRTVLVTDAGHRLVGSVSLDAVMRQLRPTQAGRTAARLFQRSIRFEFEPLTVADVMQPLPIVVPPDQTVDAVAGLMIGRRLTFVPVIGADGTLLGVVDATTVMALLYKQGR